MIEPRMIHLQYLANLLVRFHVVSVLSTLGKLVWLCGKHKDIESIKDTAVSPYGALYNAKVNLRRSLLCALSN